MTRRGLVTLACASALLSLAPDWALGELEPILLGKDDSKRELVAIALGQSGRDDSLSICSSPISREQSRLMSARPSFVRWEPTGVTRARDFYWRRVSSGSAPEARAALAALESAPSRPDCPSSSAKRREKTIAAELDRWLLRFSPGKDVRRQVSSQ